MAISSFTAVQAETSRAAPTIFVVDGDTKVHATISMLAGSVGLRVEAYSHGREFLERYDIGRPGCLILELRIPDVGGLAIQRRLNAGGYHLPIIFLTAYGEIPLATEAMRAGAVDFIQKPFSPNVLLERINEAIDRDCDQRHRLDLAHDVRQRISRLTARERMVMEHLAVGASSKVIAQRLAISPKTVDNHRTKLLEKLNVDNTTQLAHLLAGLDRQPADSKLNGRGTTSTRA